MEEWPESTRAKYRHLLPRPLPNGIGSYSFNCFMSVLAQIGAIMGFIHFKDVTMQKRYYGLKARRAWLQSELESVNKEFAECEKHYKRPKELAGVVFEGEDFKKLFS